MLFYPLELLKGVTKVKICLFIPLIRHSPIPIIFQVFEKCVRVIGVVNAGYMYGVCVGQKLFIDALSAYDIDIIGVKDVYKRQVYEI